MKNTFFLIMSLTLLFACSNENSNSENLNANLQLEFSAKNFVNETIAYDNNGDIKLGISKDELLNSFNDYSAKYEIGTHAESYLIELIDGKNYVRFYNKRNNGISTSVNHCFNKKPKRHQRFFFNDI